MGPPIQATAAHSGRRRERFAPVSLRRATPGGRDDGKEKIAVAVIVPEGRQVNLDGAAGVLFEKPCRQSDGNLRPLALPGGFARPDPTAHRREINVRVGWD